MAEIDDLMIEGEICLICRMDFKEPYGFEKACESCGGDGKLIGD